MAKKSQELLNPQDHPEYLVCLRYVIWTEWEGKSKESFANSEGIDRITLWRWTTRWQKVGLLPKVRLALGAELVEDVIVVNRKALRSWNKILTNMTRIAEGDAKSEYVQLQAGQWFFEHLVKPLVDGGDISGFEEQDYLDSIAAKANPFNPFHLLEDPESAQSPTSSASTSPDTSSSPGEAPDEPDPQSDGDTSEEYPIAP